MEVPLDTRELMKSLASRPTKKGPSAPSGHPGSGRILTEYVLHESITCLGDEDVTPLYEEYIKDSRLGDSEKAELTEVCQSLMPRASTPLAN